jgi:hypothetical protein
MGRAYIEPPPSELLWFFEPVLFLVVLFPFRLLDDLYSLAEDRKKAPTRVLCGLAELHLVWITLYGWFGVNLALLFLRYDYFQVIGYLILFGALQCWYRVADRLEYKRYFAMVPLLKYPVLVWIISGAALFSPRLWISQPLIFLACLFYEILSDPVYEKDYPWLRVSFFRQHLVFRYAFFIGVMSWFALGASGLF